MKLASAIRERKLVIERKSRYTSISKYGRIVVTDTVENGAQIRLLLVNGTRESATFTTPGLRNEPVFEYIRTIDAILKRFGETKKALIIGGAGYAFPKFYISHYTGSIDVVENNPEMVDIAIKYFYLDELFDEYDIGNNGRLRTHIDDGLHYLQHCEETYDLIINDAFVGNVADKGLLSEEGCLAVYEKLTDGGLYLVNAITARTGTASMHGIMTQEIMSRVFQKAVMTPVRPDYPADRNQNVILSAVKTGG